MPTLRLTDAVVAGAKATDGKRLELWDAGRGQGLGLRVTVDGRKSWTLRYRLPNGQRRRYTLGQYPALDLKAARTAAAAVKARVQAEKADPQGERAAERQAGTTTPRVRDLAERYMSGHDRTPGYAETKLRPATQRLYRMLWDRHILPAIGDKPIAEVGWADLDGLHQSLADSPALANRLLTLASGAFKLAQRWGWYPRDRANPGREHERYAEERVGKALDAEQLGRLGAALAQEPEGSVPAAVIRVLLLCGARPSEIRGLRWNELSGDRREIDLPAARSKVGRRSIFLGKRAARIIAAQPRRGEFVFPGPKSGKAYADLAAPWRRLRAAAQLDSYRLYDCCRHNFVSTALELGVPLERVARLVGHSVKGTTASVYSHLRRETLLADADRVASRIDAALRGELGDLLTFPTTGQS